MLELKQKYSTPCRAHPHADATERKRHLDIPVLGLYLKDLPKSKWLRLEFLSGIGNLEERETPAQAEEAFVSICKEIRLPC